MNNEPDDQKINRYDPIIGHLQSVQKYWIHDGGGSIVGYDDLWNMACNSLDRDRFEEIARNVHNLLWDHELTFVACKYGAHPGGEPYSQAEIRVPHFRQIEGDDRHYFDPSKPDEVFDITFGLCEVFDEKGEPVPNKSQWVVDLSQETHGPHRWHYIAWEEVSAALIVSWIKEFRYVAHEMCNYPALENIK